MSYADNIFINMCKDILQNGTSTEGEKVRPHWEDGTPAYTVKRFGVVNRYDLRQEFPALTLRKTALKSCFDEILWIWQKKSNNIKDLNSHIWDEWADEEGSIGMAYGYQQALSHRYDDVNMEGLQKAFPGIIRGTSNVDLDLGRMSYGYGTDAGRETYISNPIAIDICDKFYMKQIDKVLYDLVNTPFSRRIIVDMWNPKDQYGMHLTPCAYSMTFNVTQEPGCEKLILNAVLNQRSNDLLAAGNWNVCQYSLLLMMIAQCCDMIPGELVHVIADAHIYDRHIPIIQDLITRETFPAPTVWLNPDKKNFYDFTVDDLHVENYVTGPQVKNIPIAI